MKDYNEIAKCAECGQDDDDLEFIICDGCGEVFCERCADGDYCYACADDRKHRYNPFY